jgi:hypothetical protein
MSKMLGQKPPLIYLDNSGAQLGTLLVHPMEGTDSQIEGLPCEDITTDDCILVFPADTSLNSVEWETRMALVNLYL